MGWLGKLYSYASFWDLHWRRSGCPGSILHIMMKAEVQEPTPTTHAIFRPLLASYLWSFHWPMWKVKGYGKCDSLPIGLWQGCIDISPLWISKGLQPDIPSIRFGEKRKIWAKAMMRRQRTLVIVAALATNWLHKEELVHKLPNRNSLDCQLQEVRNHLFSSPLYSQCLAPWLLCCGYKVVFVERIHSIWSVGEIVTLFTKIWNTNVAMLCVWWLWDSNTEYCLHPRHWVDPENTEKARNCSQEDY